MTNRYGPTIPRAEFAERRLRLQEAMRANDIGLVVAYADDRATYGQQFARYLFDYLPHFEPALIVVPAADEAFIVTGPESDGFIQANSDCRRVVVVDAFTHPDEEYPFSAVVPLADVLAKQSAPRIAVAGLAAMPAPLRAALDGLDTTIVSGDGLFTALRAVKSPAEIAVIRHAYRIAEAGTRAAIAAIAVGVSERDVAAEAEYVMRRMGSEGMGIDTIVGAGRDNTRAILTRATARPIAADEHVLLTIAPRYEGYHGAIGRIVALGKIAPEIEAAYGVAIAAQAAARAVLKPGIDGRVVDATARRIVGDAGLGGHFAYSGVHSVGVTEFEPPILTSWNDVTLAENMVFSIDIPVFFAPWGGLRVEDGFLLTRDGNEALQTLPQEIVRI